MINSPFTILDVDCFPINFGFEDGRRLMLMADLSLITLLLIITLCGRLPKCHYLRVLCFRRCFSQFSSKISFLIIYLLDCHRR